MAENSKIEWTDHTFNPWIGCTKVSPGCDNCYAATSMDKRLRLVKWGPGQERVRTMASNWRQPVLWNTRAAAAGRRERVFCASLADWLDNEVLSTWRCDLLHLVHTTPALDWLLLSKRIGNWQPLLADALVWAGMEAGQRIWPGLADWLAQWLAGRPPANVWLGATVVDQAEADRDVPKLLAAPAVVRFLSVEPMLGPIDLEALPFGPPCTGCGQPVKLDSFTGSTSCIHACDGPQFEGLDWVICGGESGPQARPMHPDWARSLRDQCQAAGVPFFFKQWGEWLGPGQDGNPAVFIRHINASFLPIKLGKNKAGRLLDGRTHDGVPHA